MAPATTTAPSAPQLTTAAAKAEAKRLRRQGLTLKEVASELGLSVSTVHTWVGRTRRNLNAIDRELFLEFLELYTTNDAERGVLINGAPIRDESQKRGYFRWREEMTCPSHQSAEAFLHAQGLLMGRDFEDWAAERGACIWANGEPPPGYGDDDDWWWEDLGASDPEWQAEGWRAAAEHGFELPEAAVVPATVRRQLEKRRRELVKRAARDSRRPIAA